MRDVMHPVAVQIECIMNDSYEACACRHTCVGLQGVSVMGVSV